MHLSKSKRADIIDFFNDLYHNYCANQKGELVMVPIMDTVELILTVLSYTQHLTKMSKTSQKTLDENNWFLIAEQLDLKACMEEISNFK